MGVGKSSMGKKLARQLGWDFIDLDHLIENQTGKTIPEIFEKEGEPAFRDYESNALASVLTTENLVIAVGGGTPTISANADHMVQSGLCVWLDAPIGMIAQRLRNAKVERPLLTGLNDEQLNEKLNRLMEDRQPAYARSHMILSVNNLSAQGAISALKGIIQGK